MCATRQDHGKCSGEGPKAIHDRDWKREMGRDGVCPCVSLSTFKLYSLCRAQTQKPTDTNDHKRNKKQRKGQTWTDMSRASRLPSSMNSLHFSILQVRAHSCHQPSPNISLILVKGNRTLCLTHMEKLGYFRITMSNQKMRSSMFFPNKTIPRQNVIEFHMHVYDKNHNNP
jgi:hypothetical protein